MKAWNHYAIITYNTKADIPEWKRHTVILTQILHYNTTIFQTFAFKTLWKTIDKSLALLEAYGPRDSIATLFVYPSIPRYALAELWTVFFTRLSAFFTSRDCTPYLKPQQKTILFLCQLFPLIPATNTEFKAERMPNKIPESSGSNHLPMT